MSFAASPGWHQALQEIVDMNNAGCFEPGVTGTSIQAARAEFGLGQGLMVPGISAFKAAVDVTNPQFTYSFRRFPNGSGKNKPTAVLNLSPSLSVNAHSSAENQAAAQTFVDFIARPKQNALYAKIQGGLTQYEFLKGQIPGFMSDFAPVFKAHEYVLNPTQNLVEPERHERVRTYRPAHRAALNRRPPERDGRRLEQGTRVTDLQAPPCPSHRDGARIPPSLAVCVTTPRPHRPAPGRRTSCRRGER